MHQEGLFHLVIQGGVSLSAVQRVLGSVADAVGQTFRLPDDTTGRNEEIYDVAHKAACLLKGLLKADSHWKEFL